MKKIIVKDQWAEKFLRESVFMPFGSMMNAYGQINEGKGISLEEFEKISKKIFKLCLEFTEKAYDRVSQEETEIDLPTKNHENK